MRLFLKRLFVSCACLLVLGALLVMFVPPGYSPFPGVTAVFQPVASAFGKKKSLKILLLGVDYNYDDKAQRYTKGARSDTILLLRVEPLGKDLSMLSIPRDLFVGIGPDAEHGFDRINAAYSIGGEKLAIATVEKLTKLRVDHFVAVKSDVVADLVDAIGGVPIDVEKQMDWDDNWAGLHIHLRPGKQVLSGKDAVGYCRFRRDAEGDFGRIRRQQNFLTALLRELKQKKHWTKYPKLAEIVQAKMKTDLRTEQMVGLARIYKDFPLANIRKGRPEVVDYFVNGAAYLSLAPGEPRRSVRKIFPRLVDSSVRGISVILEASPRHEAQAQDLSAVLKERGFRSVRIRKVKDDGGSDSTIVFRSEDSNGGQVLRDIFPQLKMSKERAKGRPEATLTIRSKIFVSSDS